jgi:NADH-quinone oxidoreductase subunit K
MNLFVNYNLLNIGAVHYLGVAAIVFIVGICGILLNRKNIITILMSIELILLSVNINLVTFSAYLKDLHGQIFSLFVLTIAAAESAIGLAIIVVYYRKRNTIEIEDISELRG